MQTQNPFLDEFAKLTTAAMGLAQAASEEAKTAFRSQAEKFVADFDLVRRDELDAVKAELSAHHSYDDWLAAEPKGETE